MFSLARHTIDIWFCRTSEQLPDYYRQQMLSLLDATEQNRYQRFRFDKDKVVYLVSHALLRTVLSRYLDRLPLQLQFDQLEKGKPFLIGNDLQFNLSHTRGMTALAVTSSGRLGVDVEYTNRANSPLDIADHYFTPAERQEIFSQKGEDAQINRFFSFWTLKESYIKAVGQGLSIPLDQFGFSVEQGAVGFFAEGSACYTGDWHFASYPITHEHAFAVGYQHPECLSFPQLQFYEVPVLPGFAMSDPQRLTPDVITGSISL